MVILRFIPAYAGNSMELMTLTKVCSVHPRLRGELVRVGTGDVSPLRFIPAYAGNSSTEGAVCAL